MFLVKKNTVIQVEIPKSEMHWSTISWRPYTTKEDKIYDKEEVWDNVAVHNERDDIPLWARRNITEHNYVVLSRNGKFALVRPADIEYLD